MYYLKLALLAVFLDISVCSSSMKHEGDSLKVVCYFPNWAWYRPGLGKYLPENIDPNLCTHVVYAFATLDGDSLTMKVFDSWADLDNHFYKRVTDLQKKGTKVLLSIGGWNDSANDKYSRLVANAAARQKFVSQAVEFLLQYNFDGLDLDWEYPKCRQGNCGLGPDTDKEGFASLIKELRQEFNNHNLLLSSAVAANKVIIDAGYDIQALSSSLDWIGVMTYDYHGPWEQKTGHCAPLYAHDGMDVGFNVDDSITHWLNVGVPSHKIVMGIPLYGKGFSLASTSNHGLNAPTWGPSTAGEYTREGGTLSYYEICDRIKHQGWTKVTDPGKRYGPYAFQGNQWVGFDDKDMVQVKAQYIKQKNLGGGMIWDLSDDDFGNICGDGANPLLSTLSKELRS